jgi:hypothetical protein
VCRVLAAICIVGSLLSLAKVGLSIWSLTGTEEGLFAQPAEVLGVLAGFLAGGLFLALLGIWLFQRASNKFGARQDEGQASPASKPQERASAPALTLSKGRSGRWPSCNVFQLGPERHQVWHFDPRGKKYAPRGSQMLAASQPMPARIAGKPWQTLLQPRVNVAWLPPEQVFLRIVQVPQCTREEMRAMIELQLEKLSPIPVAQTVWTTCELGAGEPGMQTVLVVFAEREEVEKFVGRIEEAGLLADRLDVPGADQLLALKPTGDGAYVFPELFGGPASALVGWWYGGILRNLGLVHLPQDGQGAAGLTDQLRQMAWAGEIEGWLTAAPRWHLVASGDTEARWRPLLQSGLQEPIEILAPVPPEQLALSSATRSATAMEARGLLPAEYATRYKQQFTDRIWMRSLGALMVLYLAGVAVYFALLGLENWRTGKVEQEVASLGTTYTNALQLKARFEVLNELQELKYAALDCWKLACEHMPASATLDGLNFADGKELRLNGSAPESAAQDLIDFSQAMRKARVNDKPMFDPNLGEQLNTRTVRGDTMTWNFTLVLKRSEVR